MWWDAGLRGLYEENESDDLKSEECDRQVIQEGVVGRGQQELVRSISDEWVWHYDGPNV